MEAKALRERIEKLISDARAISDKAEKENRGLSAEEVESQRKMLDDAKLAKAQLRNAEELATEEAALRASLPESQRTERKHVEKPEAAAYNAALRSYICNGFGGMTHDEQRALRQGYREFTAEERAQSTLSGAAGGYDVAPDTSFYGKIQAAKKFFGGMDQAGCSVLTTDTGADLPIPTMDDTSNAGSIVAEEGSHASGTNVSLSQVTLHAYVLSSKIVKVSWQLLQDSASPWEDLLARVFGQRLGRARNTYLTTGTGSAQPQGVVTAASSGRQSATGNASSVPFDDFLRLEHSVDRAYRQMGKYMLNDSTALAVRLLKDGNGQYLWRTGEGGQPDRINSYPVVINNDMASMSASAKHTLFGDFSNYFIRNVKGITIVRLNELYAENGQVGFLAFERFDGGLVDAGQHPIKYLQNSAS